MSTAVRASGLLPVGGGHEIYWEESGDPHGIPALYLHGGPGGGLGKGGYRERFDPQRFRIVGLDQRGCELVVDEDEGRGGANMAEAWQAANTRHAQRVGTA
ncbi:hypothetical protein [Georgenia alba]|uniref:Prolyl aminopeptidase n=1 Tax=Georgenia alba TaxID=2233858 RepID=A0ABW2QAV6_9MICO